MNILVTMPEYVSAIEQQSELLLEVSQQTQEEMQRYYPRLLTDDCPDAETQGRVESLKRATNNMTKALTQTATVNDELNAFDEDLGLRRQLHNGCCLFIEFHGKPFTFLVIFYYE